MQRYATTNAQRFARAGTALLLAFTACAAVADPADYCVGTDSELVSALSIAQTTPLTVKLQQNTYHLNQTAWNAKLTPAATGKFAAGSSLLGGYTNATCTTRNIGVGNTIVTDTTQTPDDEVNILGDATIEGITFELANGLLIGADASENGALPNGSQLTIRRNVFVQTTGDLPLYVYWNEDSAVGGVVRIVNNLLHDNSSGVATSDAASIFAYVPSGKPTIELINNTAVNNGGSLGGFGLLNLVTPVPVFAYNNIFYGNTGSDFAVNQGSDITLGKNVIKNHSWAGTIQNDGTTTADPKLDATTFRPIESPASYVINSGTATVKGGLPATDLSGRDRQIGTEPDRGAFESTINDYPILSVTTTADSGVGSLRSAIASANMSGSALILFDLGPDTGCPYTIAPQTPLPNITSSIAFAGYSQAGSVQNSQTFGFNATICVILDGTPHNLSDGLYVPNTAAGSVQMQVSGLAFSGFSHGAISIYGGSAHTVSGSRIGGANGGVALDPSGNGIILGPDVNGVTIGGGTLGTEIKLTNLIGAATSGGVVLDGPSAPRSGAHDNSISGNLIGVGYNANNDTYVDRGNGSAGVTIAGANNQINYNLIGYNNGYGINVTGSDANNNFLFANEIGIPPSGTDIGMGNAGGIVFQNSAHDNLAIFGSVKFNTGTGVRVVNGQNNTITAIALYGNGGLGIDLAGAGVTANDNDSDPQPVGYANRGLNFPVLSGAIGGHNHGTVTGSLLTTPGSYIIELFVSPACDASGNGEGAYYIGSVYATTGNTGANGQFLAPFSFQTGFVDFVSTPFITATASDASGNTSEFSACKGYVDDTIFANGFD